MPRLLCLLILSCTFSGWSFNAKAQELKSDIFLSTRHIIILQADLKYIWGTYYFAVTNQGTEPAQFKTYVSLPAKTLDFKAQDGLSDADLKLDQDGRLYIDRSFKPGLNLLGIGFQIAADGSAHDSIIFSPLVDIPELSIAIPVQSGLKVSGEQFQDGVPPMLAGGKYIGMIAKEPVGAGQDVVIEVHGIPKEKGKFQLLGAIVAVLLFALGGLLTMKTKDKLKEQEESSF